PENTTPHRCSCAYAPLAKMTATTVAIPFIQCFISVIVSSSAMQPHGYGFSFLPAAGGTKIHNPHPANQCRCRFRPAIPPPVLTERGVLQRPPDRPHEQASCTERTATECRSRKKSPPSNVLHALCNNLAPRRPAASSANSRAATCPPHRPHPKNRFCVTPASLPGTRQQPTNDATKPDGSPVVPQEHAATGRPMQRPRKRASPPPATHRHRPVAAETATLFRSSCPQPFTEGFGTLRNPPGSHVSPRR